MVIDLCWETALCWWLRDLHWIFYSEIMVIDGTAPNRSLPVYLIQVPLQKNPTSLNPKNKRGKWKSPINVGFEYV